MPLAGAEFFASHVTSTSAAPPEESPLIFVNAVDAAPD